MGKATVTPIGGGGEVQAATAATAGIVKLSDSTTSTSGAASGVAATPAAVKAAMDAAQPYAYPISGYTPLPYGDYPFWNGDTGNSEGRVIAVPGGMILRCNTGRATTLFVFGRSGAGGKQLCVVPTRFDLNLSGKLKMVQLGNTILHSVECKDSNFVEFVPCVVYTKN